MSVPFLQPEPGDFCIGCSCSLRCSILFVM